MALWVKVLNKARKEGEEELDFRVSLGSRPEDSLLAKRMERNHGSQEHIYVIEALAGYDDGQAELQDLVQVAFELGREWGVEHGTAPKKKRLRANKKK